MADVHAVRVALAEALSSIDRLRTFAYQPDNVMPPIAFVTLDRIEYDLNAHRGADTQFYLITVVVGRASDRSAQNALNDYLVGSASVKAAVERDRSLGGTVNTCRVTEARNYEALSVGDETYLQVIFDVEVVG
jgi:hypothetical protein